MPVAVRVAALSVCCALGGCASIVSGQHQPVSVAAVHGNTFVSGATCALSNDKGTWYVNTPGSTTVQRSFQDLAVNCSKPSLPPGALLVKSGVKGLMLGNILAGGVIGAGVDHATGAAYDYPNVITVLLGRSGTFPTGPVDSFEAPGDSTVSATPMAPSPLPVVASPAALPANPVTQSAVVAAPIGKESHQIERMPAVRACNASPTAVLTGKGPGVETYTVACSNGDFVTVRCEFSSCRVLK